MTVYKCKICGGNLEIIEGFSVCTCEYCGTEQTLPRLDSDRKLNLYDRANHFRRNGDFDKAMGIYEQILNEDTMDSEAYWSIVLCKYGIEYVEDPSSHSRIPTVNRTQYTSIYADGDYKSALEYADPLQRDLYEKEARSIDEIQKSILAISEKEKPFDIFICYKETDANGNRTQDSVLANDIYYNLTDEGFHVFFSKITLESIIGQSYEPYIFAALNSARVMVVIGTKPEHLQAAWVRNEWSRFLVLTRQNPGKILIPAYRDMDPYDLPEEFSHLQAQDMGKLGFMQDLIRGIEKILSKDVQRSEGQPAEIAPQDDKPGVASLLRRGHLFLEDEEWKSAHKYFDKVLDIDPENAEAYLGQLLAARRVHSRDELVSQENTFDKEPLYQKALRFADEDFRTILTQMVEENKRISEEKLRLNRERLPQYRKRIALVANCIANGGGHTVGLKSDGKVEAAGHYSSVACHVSGWTDIVAIAASSDYTVGVKSDGRVVAVGGNDHGECNGWTDIVAIAVGYGHTVGLKSDGRVEAVGDNKYGQCDVWGWTDIVVIAAGDFHTVGLKSDGRVVAVGNNIIGECDVSGWTDIVAIAVGHRRTVGLKSDGRVVAVGYNEDGECDVSGWTDIVAIAAGSRCTVGLKNDGRVVATGYNGDGRCDVSSWRNIVTIAAGYSHTVGLKSDGRVVAVGYNEDGECDVSGWTDIVAIDASDGRTVGLKSNGRVEAVGSNRWGECNVSGWRLFQSLEILEKEKEQKIKYDAAYAKYTQDIEREINEKKYAITMAYGEKRQPLTEAQNDRIKEIDDERRALEEKKHQLEQQRSSLGMFQTKQKTAIREQINTLAAKIRALPSEHSIRQEYASQMSAIDLQERQEFQKLEASIPSIREKYIMPKLEDFMDE